MIRNSFILGLIVWSVALSQFADAGTWKDSFEDNDMSEWKIVPSANGAGKWWSDKGEAVAESLVESGRAMWLTGESTWRYYTLSCQAKLVESKKEPSTFGIVMHFYREGLLPVYYAFRVIPDFNLITIRKFRPLPANPVTLGELDFESEMDKWYQLTATIHKNGTIEFQINKKVFTLFDPNPLGPGQTGLFVTNAETRFDDVEITGSNIFNGGPGTSGRQLLTTTWGYLKSE